MIASIKKCKEYRNIIEYHFEKIAKGKAKLLANFTFSMDENAASIISALDDHLLVSEKENIKYQAHHISLSLNINENISDELFAKIAKEYLSKMGYSGCPFIVIRHFDKKNEHIHIVVSTVNDWKKVIEHYNDFSKSQRISREIEKEFGLKITEYTNKDKTKNLNEINFRKYYLHNAIKKASRNKISKEFVDKMFTKAEREVIFSKNPLTQKQLESILGKNRYHVLYDHLIKKGYFNTYYKKELMAALDSILEHSLTFEDYIKNCQKSGIYARVNFSPSGMPYIKYRGGDTNHYFKDVSLDGRFRYDYLSQKYGHAYNKELKSRTFDQQVNYIRKQVEYAINNSNGFDNFKNLLAKKGIETILYENEKGTYRIKFKDLNSKGPYPVDSAMIDEKYTFDYIKGHFNLPDIYMSQVYEIPTIEIQPDLGRSIYIPDFNIIDGHEPELPENLRKRKKYKRKFKN